MSDDENNDATYLTTNVAPTEVKSGAPIGNYQRGNIFVTSRGKSEENIPDKIGKGDDAKNSVVWHVITYSLTIYSCIVAALLVIDVLNNGGQSALDIVKDSWAIFTPIITLSLGYMFGKKEDDRAQKNDDIESR